jgi:phosphatidylglycerophosphate synthase
MPRALRRHAANALTLLRIGLTPAFLIAVWRAAHGGPGWPAGALFALIAASDFADGRVARRLGAASPIGRIMDPIADVGFLLAALAVYAWLGLAPWWVPAAIAASFAAYVIDTLSRGAARGTSLGNRLGHLGGVLNFVVVGVLVYDQTAGLRWLPGWMLGLLFAAVPLYSGAAIALRLRGEPRAAAPPLSRRAPR